LRELGKGFFWGQIKRGAEKELTLSPGDETPAVQSHVGLSQTRELEMS
jgi:hypothetical protein